MVAGSVMIFRRCVRPVQVGRFEVHWSGFPRFRWSVWLSTDRPGWQAAHLSGFDRVSCDCETCHGEEFLWDENETPIGCPTCNPDGKWASPPALDAIADIVLAYKPMPKSKPAKKRKRLANKTMKCDQTKWRIRQMSVLRKVNDEPGLCDGCQGTGRFPYFEDEPSRPRDMRCESCQGTGEQSERQILINKGANAAILGAMI